MLRKTFAALMLIAAIATAIGAVPGVLENVVHACPSDDILCDN